MPVCLLQELLCSLARRLPLLGKLSLPYPGTVGSGTFPTFVYTDNGAGFESLFEQGVRDRGGTRTRSLENIQKTHARRKHFQDDLERDVAASLTAAGSPYHLWGYVVRHWCYCIARMPDGRPDGKSPWERRHGRPYEGDLQPVGRGCTYVLEKEERETFGK